MPRFSLRHQHVELALSIRGSCGMYKVLPTLSVLLLWLHSHEPIYHLDVDSLEDPKFP